MSLAFFKLLIVSVMYGQAGVIVGHVTHRHLPVEGAFAYIQRLGIGEITDSTGTFYLSAIPVGFHQLNVTCPGFVPLSLRVKVTADDTLYLPLPMSADPLFLDPVTVTAGRGEWRASTAPVIVSQISPHVLTNTQSLVLSEGLRFAPGLRMENNCQNCGFSQVRMNGLEGPYTQILINSRPVFSALAGVYALDMLPASMIDRIEVVRGAGSVAFGGNAIAGTINIITREPVRNEAEAGIDLAWTGMEQPDRTISFQGSVVCKDLRKGMHLYAYQRDRRPWDANADGFSEITLLRNHTFGMDGFWEIDPRTRVKMHTYHIQEFRRGGDAFDLPPHQSALTEQVNHRITGLQTSVERSSQDYQHRGSIYTSLQHIQRDSYYGGGGRVLVEGDSLTADDVLAINAYGMSEDLVLVGGMQYSYEPGGSWGFTLGTEYQYNRVQDAMPGYERLIRQSVGAAAGYAELEYRPLPRLSLLAGGRLDRTLVDGRYELLETMQEEKRVFTVIVPRVAALYTLSERWRWRASYAQGYRAPQAFDEDLHVETVGGSARVIRLDPDLLMERSESWTSSVNYQYLQGEKRGNVVLEVFHTRLRDPFLLSDPEVLPNGVLVLTKRNGEAAVVQGFNLEANIAWGSRLVVQSGLTVQSARYQSAETLWASEDPGDNRDPTVTDRILRTPDSYGYLSASYDLRPDLRLSWSVVYTGPMEAPHVIEPDDGYLVLRRTPVFWEQSPRLAWTLPLRGEQEVQVYVGVHNLFNSYQRDFDTGPERDAGYIYGPMRPRTIYVGCRLKFRG
jgi:outer membrane receptor for ferrienterochelin and colicins